MPNPRHAEPLMGAVHRRRFLECLTVGLAAATASRVGATAATPAPALPVPPAPNPARITRDDLVAAVSRGAAWLTDVAQVTTLTVPPEENDKGYGHTDWRGATRTEYSARNRQWRFMGPAWHSGQAAKALVMAHQLTGEARWLEAALRAARFVRGLQETRPGEDAGLIAAEEDTAGIVNVSAIHEAIDVFFMLEPLAPGQGWTAAALQALDWLARRSFKPGEGLFRDAYSLREHRWVMPAWQFKNRYDGRPLLDDGVFLRGFQAGGPESHRKIFFETAERLLREEEPAGNWIHLAPANVHEGTIHPRHAYWWGYPMQMAYRESRDRKFLDCAIRAGRWYVRAQRRDGALFRETHLDFSTPAFVHENSGIFCACKMWTGLFELTGDPEWIAPLVRSIRFGLSAQFRNPADPNLRGAILERVSPPDGTDRPPFYLRDLGTAFFIQAVAALLNSPSTWAAFQDAAMDQQGASSSGPSNKQPPPPLKQ